MSPAYYLDNSAIQVIYSPPLPPWTIGVKGYTGFKAVKYFPNRIFFFPRKSYEWNTK